MAPTAIKPAAVSRARTLRQNMTDGERKLWSKLREFRKLYGLHVRKQVPIGPYVADFAIHSKKIVIEVDGEHHFLPDRMYRIGWQETENVMPGLQSRDTAYCDLIPANCLIILTGA